MIKVILHSFYRGNILSEQKVDGEATCELRGPSIVEIWSHVEGI